MIFLILNYHFMTVIKAIVKFGDETTIKRLISLLTISNSSIIKNTLYHLCKFLF